MANERNIHYYRKELDYLHETREIFVKNFPKLAPFLSTASREPDIERLIENFAILTAKLHQEIDNNIPLIAESLINIISPNYTNPLPSTCLQEFFLSQDSKELHYFIPRGTQIKSHKIKGVQCIFETIYDVYLYPLRIQDTFITSSKNGDSLTLNITSHTSISDLNITQLNIFLGTDIYTSTLLLMWLLSYTSEILITIDNEVSYKIPLHSLKTLGLEQRAYNQDSDGFEAFCLLQELFFMPEKFNFISIDNLDILRQCSGDSFKIKFTFIKPLPKECMPKANLFSLSTSPIVNSFHIAAEPIVSDFTNNSHRIFIDRSKLESYEIIEIKEVKSHDSSTGHRIFKNYKSFDRFAMLNDNEDFYSITNKLDSNNSPYRQISFFSTNQQMQTISIETISCNKDLPTLLRLGDISIMDNDKIITKNITTPTPMKQTEISGEILWKLVSMLSFSYKTLLDKRTFLSAIEAYSFHLNSDDSIATKIANSLLDIAHCPIYRIERGFSKKGILCIMKLDSTKFYCIGELYRAGLVISKFLASFASINSFCELKIESIDKKGEISILDYTHTNGKKAIL